MIKLLLIGVLSAIGATNLAEYKVSTKEKHVATAFCLTGKMSNGQRTRRGVVAMDTRLYPLGTMIRISDAGKYSGVYLVADTGGDIKKKRTDIWMSCSEAKIFGKRNVTVEKI